MGKGIENTYQCKQDCGISHFGNHETHDFDVPRNKAMHLFDYNSHKPPNFHHFFFLPKQFFYTQTCLHEWERNHIQYTLKTKGEKKISLPWELISNKYTRIHIISILKGIFFFFAGVGFKWQFSPYLLLKCFK